MGRRVVITMTASRRQVRKTVTHIRDFWINYLSSSIRLKLIIKKTEN